MTVTTGSEFLKRRESLAESKGIEPYMLGMVTFILALCVQAFTGIPDNINSMLIRCAWVIFWGIMASVTVGFGSYLYFEEKEQALSVDNPAMAHIDEWVAVMGSANDYPIGHTSGRIHSRSTAIRTLMEAVARYEGTIRTSRLITELKYRYKQGTPEWELAKQLANHAVMYEIPRAMQDFRRIWTLVTVTIPLIDFGMNDEEFIEVLIRDGQIPHLNRS